MTDYSRSAVESHQFSSVDPSRDREHSWTSVFRLGNSSSRKLSSTPSSSPLTLDTHVLPILPSSSSTTVFTQNSASYYDCRSTLTPGGSRSSYNSISSNPDTNSSRSSEGIASPSSSRSYAYNTLRSANGASSSRAGTTSTVSQSHKLAVRSSKPSLMGLGRSRTSSSPNDIHIPANNNGTHAQESHLLHPRSASHNHQSTASNHKKKVQTAHASQASFNLPPTSSPTSPGPSSSHSGPRLTPKSMTRFIRRVASAPNAKGLFALGGSTSTKSPKYARKNGMLAAPGDEMVPPLPVAIGAGNTNSSIEVGTDSLETISSGGSSGTGPSTSSPSPPRAQSISSKARNSALPSPSSIAQSFSFSRHSSGTTKDWDKLNKSNGTTTRVVSNANSDGPGKVAFRRTYSSNSIKVREVGA